MDSILENLEFSTKLKTLGGEEACFIGKYKCKYHETGGRWFEICDDGNLDVYFCLIKSDIDVIYRAYNKDGVKLPDNEIDNSENIVCIL